MDSGARTKEDRVGRSGLRAMDAFESVVCVRVASAILRMGWTRGDIRACCRKRVRVKKTPTVVYSPLTIGCSAVFEDQVSGLLSSRMELRLERTRQRPAHSHECIAPSEEECEVGTRFQYAHPLKEATSVALSSEFEQSRVVGSSRWNISMTRCLGSSDLAFSRPFFLCSLCLVSFFITLLSGSLLRKVRHSGLDWVPSYACWAPTADCILSYCLRTGKGEDRCRGFCDFNMPASVASSDDGEVWLHSIGSAMRN
nr:hypothetical protein CFP56_70202 [Quercus suber]